MRIVFAAIILVGLSILGYVWLKQGDEVAPQTIERVIEISDPVEIAVPEIRHPVPDPIIPENLSEDIEEDTEITEVIEEASEKQPQTFNLPELDQSDAYVQSGIESIIDSVYVSELINFTSLIEKFVVTIDNLTSPKLPTTYRFIAPVGNKFMIFKNNPDDEVAILDSQNYARYEPFIKLTELIDLNAVTRFYFMSYPLFQKAYENLGYPDRYFNDRLVEVIDHLLDTPQVNDPIELKQPKVFYTYADSNLEALSAGQKILIRVGTQNSTRLKQRLSELRRIITSQ